MLSKKLSSCIKVQFIKYKHYKCYVKYSGQFRRYLELNGFPNIKLEGEDEYVNTWAQFSGRVDRFSYRFFSHYMEDRSGIVPENIGRSYLEPVLNPIPMRRYYSDKSIMPLICGKEAFPRTALARINGGPILDGNLNPIKVEDELNIYLEVYDSLFLKPSVCGRGGKNIKLYNKSGGKWYSSDDNSLLTKELLLRYANDFVLQEAVIQHADLAVLNPSSVNTVRIAVYRSFKDNSPHILACSLRVGKKDNIVDNTHSGGMSVGIDIMTGKVGNCLFDIYGRMQTNWNGVDYCVDRYIPNWEDIKTFACDMAKKILHHRLIAMDIAINKVGAPLLIEYNLDAFSYRIFMIHNQNPLGDYMQEIIEYCSIKALNNK